MRDLLNLQAESEWLLLPARRIASGASSFERVIRVRRGKNDGVQPGMAVLHSRGIVGQVFQVFARTADVLLLVDRASAIDVVIQRSRARGILRGEWMRELRFQYLMKEEDLQVGDEVISTGLDGVYPARFPVGVVKSVEAESQGLFLKASVEPYVDFSRVEEVAIVLGAVK